MVFLHPCTQGVLGIYAGFGVKATEKTWFPKSTFRVSNASALQKQGLPSDSSAGLQENSVQHKQLLGSPQNRWNLG